LPSKALHLSQGVPMSWVRNVNTPFPRSVAGAAADRFTAAP